MTPPKEKARELVDRFDEFTIHHSWREKNDDAIKCALIAVDEVRDNLPLISDIQQYWIEVKQEINGI